MDALIRHDALLTAGRTLATLADRDKDLLSYAGEIEVISIELEATAQAIERAYDEISEARLAQPDDGSEMHARLEATRTAKRSLVELARVIAEMEAE